MKKMRGYKNVYCVGEEKAKQDHMFYKYMNVERAIQFLKTGEYYFVEPTAWQDPYEKRFYTADYSHFDSFIPGVTYATCLTDKISNEPAWKKYRDEGDMNPESFLSNFRGSCHIAGLSDIYKAALALFPAVRRQPSITTHRQDFKDSKQILEDLLDRSLDRALMHF